MSFSVMLLVTEVDDTVVRTEAVDIKANLF